MADPPMGRSTLLSHQAAPTNHPRPQVVTEKRQRQGKDRWLRSSLGSPPGPHAPSGVAQVPYVTSAPGVTVSATLENEADPTLENEATGSCCLVCRVLGSDAGQGVDPAVA